MKFYQTQKEYSIWMKPLFHMPYSGKVLGVKGQKNLYQVHTGSEKENITVLCNVNASGKHAPTLIIYPGQRLPPSERLKVPDD